MVGSGDGSEEVDVGREDSEVVEVGEGEGMIA